MSLVLRCRSQGFFEKGCRASSESPSYLCLEPFGEKTPRIPLRQGKMWGMIALKLRGGEDSLFTNAELAAGVVSSILRDSDLKKVEALCVEEALALSL